MKVESFPVQKDSVPMSIRIWQKYVSAAFTAIRVQRANISLIFSTFGNNGQFRTRRAPAILNQQQFFPFSGVYLR